MLLCRFSDVAVEDKYGSRAYSDQSVGIRHPNHVDVDFGLTSLLKCIVRGE